MEGSKDLNEKYWKEIDEIRMIESKYDAPISHEDIKSMVNKQRYMVQKREKYDKKYGTFLTRLYYNLLGL